MADFNHWWLTIVLGMVYAGIQAVPCIQAFCRTMPDDTKSDAPIWNYTAIVGSFVALAAMLACPVPIIQRFAWLPVFLDPTLVFAAFVRCAKEFKYRKL